RVTKSGAGFTRGLCRLLVLSIVASLAQARCDRWRIGTEMRKVEQVHQIADRRAIHRTIAASRLNGVWQVVAAAARELGQAPVALDEFQDRHMVIIGVIDKTLLGVGRYDDQRDTGAVTEEVDRLNIA